MRAGRRLWLYATRAETRDDLNSLHLAICSCIHMVRATVSDARSKYVTIRVPTSTRRPPRNSDSAADTGPRGRVSDV